MFFMVVIFSTKPSIYLFERGKVGGGGRGGGAVHRVGGRGEESQADSALNIKPDVGLDGGLNLRLDLIT